LDRRLTALAARFGATYSRYADDLVLSGGPLLRRAADTVAAAVTAIARDEGFHVNDAKRRMATRAGAQRVCGIVVNGRPNLARRDFDRLKAVLHDAALQGPAAANRDRVALDAKLARDATPAGYGSARAWRAMSAQGSPTASRRSGSVRSVQRWACTPGSSSSSHTSGTATGAPGSARTA
ncbi:MAG: RNA-directed polymerase, partial [Solirubrobacteraceae bacterium]|nr:RNA-directed polymerase [Solirubrobacteraceae bacterium]